MPTRQNESSRSSSKPGRRGGTAAYWSGSRSTMPNQATARALESDIVSRLAKFFPEATPVRIPIKLSRSNSNGYSNNKENGDVNGHENEKRFLHETVIAFGTPHEVLLFFDLPLEFAYRVPVETL